MDKVGYKLEYGYFDKYKLWAVFIIDDSGMVKDFEYYDENENIIKVIKRYCNEYQITKITEIHNA